MNCWHTAILLRPSGGVRWKTALLLRAQSGFCSFLKDGIIYQHNLSAILPGWETEKSWMTCFLSRGWRKKGSLGSLGLTWTHCYIKNRSPTGTYCRVQGTLLNVTRQHGWEQSSGESGYMHGYVRVCMSPVAVHVKLCEHCWLALLQYNIRS